MRVRRFTSILAAVAVAAVASPASAPAAADEPGAVLTLSWSAPAASNQVFTTTLTCDPAGGGEEWYMDPVLACDDLAAADGNIDALPGRLHSCDGVQGWAIRTTVNGHWYGEPVAYDELHANWCEVRKKLGWLFTF